MSVIPRYLHFIKEFFKKECRNTFFKKEGKMTITKDLPSGKEN